jgi:DNA-binding IclR family transcriptional regulator
MGQWSFLTSHGQALLLIAHDPEIRLRDIAIGLKISERRAYGIVDDLTQAGYLVKERVGRRNKYEVQGHLPMPPSASGRSATSLISCSETVRILSSYSHLRAGKPSRLAEWRELGRSEATEDVQRAPHLVDFVVFDGGDGVDEAHPV